MIAPHRFYQPFAPRQDYKPAFAIAGFYGPSDKLNAFQNRTLLMPGYYPE
jgi:hypothetical protein